MPGRISPELPQRRLNRGQFGGHHSEDTTLESQNSVEISFIGAATASRFSDHAGGDFQPKPTPPALAAASLVFRQIPSSRMAAR